MSTIVSSDKYTKKRTVFLLSLASPILFGCGGGSNGSSDETIKSTDNSPNSVDTFLSMAETKSVSFQDENQSAQTSNFRYLEVPSRTIKTIDTEGSTFVLEQTSKSKAIYLRVSGQLTIK